MASASISLATPAQSALLSKIGCETFTETFGHLYSEENLSLFLNTQHSQAYYHDLITDPAVGVWLISSDNEIPVGYGAAGPCGLPVPDCPDNAGELKRLYLYHAFHGCGHGTKLLEHILEWLESHFSSIYVSVYSENTGAQRLYQRYGFEKILDYEFMVGNHADPEFLMQHKPKSVSL